MSDTTTVAAPETPEYTFRKPTQPGYLGFAASAGLSSLGDAAWFVGVTVALTDLVSPAVAGTILSLCSLPQLAGLLVGGAVADRVGHRRVMFTADVLRCAVLLVAGVAAFTVDLPIPAIIAVLVALTVLGAFFDPASGALRPELLPPDQMLRGNSIFLLGSRGGQAAGGPIGAALMAAGGFAAVAVFDAVSFAVSALAVRMTGPVKRIRAAEPAEPGPAAERDPAAPGRLRRLGTEIRFGLSYVGAQRDLLWLIVIIGISELACSGPVNIGLVLIAQEHGSATGAGVLLTAFTIGATGSYLLTSVWPIRRRAGLIAVAGLAAQALLTGILGYLSAFPATLAVYLGLGMLSGFIGNVFFSLIQRWAAKEVRGRVMSVLNVPLFVAASLGNMVMGVMVQSLGMGTTFLAHGLLDALAVLIALRPAIRSAHLS
ncbi:MFS transporter [Kitasatospora sp. NPDC101157]|uniref:MFS transporter n=1 Tax=Kitasatospora sp. NPDC101157 TaxID=3364098 RepID=UPI003817882D